MRIVPFVNHYLKPSQFYVAKANIKELVVVTKADFLGHTRKETMEHVQKHILH